jgi:hypothetical protein
MSQDIHTLEHKRDDHRAQPLPTTPTQIREALTRLREVGEKLPPVDAVTIIREGREAAQESR